MWLHLHEILENSNSSILTKTNELVTGDNEWRVRLHRIKRACWKSQYCLYYTILSYIGVLRGRLLEWIHQNDEESKWETSVALSSWNFKSFLFSQNTSIAPNYYNLFIYCLSQVKYSTSDWFHVNPILHCFGCLSFAMVSSVTWKEVF